MSKFARCLKAPAMQWTVHNLVSELFAEGVPIATDETDKGRNLADCSLAGNYLLPQ